jgi:putative hydrolase of the HAD superfamily
MSLMPIGPSATQDGPKMKHYIFWDFDGTLAHRDGLWSSALRDAIRHHLPTFEVTIETLDLHLRHGFPWHTPEVEHSHILSNQAWWDALSPVFARALAALGIGVNEQLPIVASVKTEYLRLDAWRVSAGADAVLETLSREGWTHILISNHVPELPGLVAALGLAPHFERVFCSAELGVEKPNPAFLSRILASLGSYGSAWVVGDNIRADIGAANAAGLPSILIGSSDMPACRCASSIQAVPGILRQFPRSPPVT